GGGAGRVPGGPDAPAGGGGALVASHGNAGVVVVGKRAEGPKGRERRKPPAPSASSTRIPGLAPRFAAWRVLHDVRHWVPFDVALRRALQDLEPADRHLAQELAAGVFKSRVQLDARLAPALQRGPHSVRPRTL